MIVAIRDLPGKLVGVGLPFIVLSEVLSGAYALTQNYASLKARIYGDILKLIPRLLEERSRLLGRGDSSLLLGVLEGKVTVDFNHVIFSEARVTSANRLFRGIARLLSPFIGLGKR